MTLCYKRNVKANIKHFLDRTGQVFLGLLLVIIFAIVTRLGLQWKLLKAYIDLVAGFGNIQEVVALVVLEDLHLFLVELYLLDETYHDDLGAAVADHDYLVLVHQVDCSIGMGLNVIVCFEGSSDLGHWHLEEQVRAHEVIHM